VTGTWEDFYKFEFDHFVYGLYFFHATPEQQRRLKDAESPEYRRFIEAAGQVFNRIHKQRLRLTWAAMNHKPDADPCGSLQREINEMFEELDQYTGGKY